MAGYKNWNSAKAVFFGKRKQMRGLYGVGGGAGEDGGKREREKVDAGVKKRAVKNKTVVVGREDVRGYGEQ